MHLLAATPSPSTTFSPADWVVLSLYLALLVATGIWFSRREQKTTSEYFLAGRKMPMWAVAVSIIATSLSAATFVGAPEQSYKGDLTYLSTNIGGIIAVIIVAWFFIPAFYRNNCTTVYELLERRFGTGSKHATSAAFMVGRLFASGARIYIAAIPLSMILFGADVEKSANYELAMILSIAALTLVGTAYALLGGISGVIWTDVIQTVVLVVAVIAAIVVLWMKISPVMPFGQVVEELNHGLRDGGSKLAVVRLGLDPGKPNFGFDPSAQFTLITAITGFALLQLAALGTDHDLVQRMLTCRNAVQGGRSVLLSMALGIPIVTCFMIVGLLLAVHHFLAGDGLMPDSKGVFVRFIITDMPPGLRALMLAGLFAAGVGSLTSAINAMAATAIKDFYTKLVPDRGERHYLAASKLAVVAWGIALGGFAVLCLYWQKASPQTTLIGLALGVMTFAYTGLLAVFLTALFTRRGSTASVIAALITGFAVIAFMQDWAWPHWTKLISPSLADVKLAFPWHMTIGTIIAFAVCCAGRRPPSILSREPSPPEPLNCTQCGYTMKGLAASAACPECGAHA